MECGKQFQREGEPRTTRDIEQEKWKDACTRVNKIALQTLNGIKDLENIREWFHDDEELCKRIPTFKYIRDNDRAKGISMLKGSRTLENPGERTQ